MATRSEPSYPDAKRPTTFEEGLLYQDFVVQQLAERLGLNVQVYSSLRYQLQRGESIQGIEIKLDILCTETGRLSIEIAEKARADMPTFVPSGIFRNDNTWLYIQGNYQRLYVFPKKLLQRVYYGHFARLFPRAIPKPKVIELPTIRKFYLDLKDADWLAAKILALPLEAQLVFREGNKVWGRSNMITG